MVHWHCPLISEDLMLSLVVVQVYPDSIKLIFTCECSLHRCASGGGGVQQVMVFIEVRRPIVGLH